MPRSDIVEALLAANDPEERATIMDDRFSDILDNCEAALSGTEHEWARRGDVVVQKSTGRLVIVYKEKLPKAGAWFTERREPGQGG